LFPAAELDTFKAGFEISKRLGPGMPVPKVAFPTSALPLLVSRNETVPVGAVLPVPPTVAVSVLLLALPLWAMAVAVGESPVTVNAATLEALEESALVPAKTAL
jgi:hypothetical protein